MAQTHQTNIRLRIRVQRTAGQVAIIIGAGLLLYSLVGSGGLAGILVMKPNFSCVAAPAAEAPVLDSAVRAQRALRLDGASRELWRAEKKDTRGSSAATVRAVRQRLAERKTALVETMRVNPEAAAEALLSKSERTALTKFAANCVETPVSYRGRLATTHYDDLDGDASFFQNTLTMADGSQVQLHIAHAEAANLPAGGTIAIRGYQIGDEVLLDAAPAPAGTDIDVGGATVISAPAAPPLTTYRAAVIMAYFADEAIPTNPTLAGMNDLLNTTINDYYGENSYGKLGYAADIYGWYQVPITMANCDYGDVSTAAFAAADPDIDFTQYTHLITYFRGVQPNCPFGGLAALNTTSHQTGEGRRNLYESIISSPTAYVVGHELGHNLGNHHAQYYPCNPPYTDYYYVYYNPACTPVEYGDYYDIMGSSFTGHFSALHKEVTNFFDPGMLVTVPAGTNEYVLEPIETTTTGLKALKILRGDNTISGSDDYLYVEYRQPIGFDTSFSAYSRDAYDGAVLHTVGAGQLYSGLFDPTPAIHTSLTATLPVGVSYTDPMSGVTVQTTGQTADALAVTVTTGRTDLTPPSVSILNPNWNDTLGGTVTVTASASDPSGIDHVDFYLTSKANPPFFTDTTAPYTAQLDTTQLPNGTTRVVATAYDAAGQAQGLAGNWLSTERSFIVDNADAIPPTVSLTSPTAGASIVSGTITATATAADTVGIWKVELYVDGSVTPAWIDTTAPYAGSANIFTLGAHSITAAAYDFAGNRVDSAPTSFTIVSDTINPTATLVAPVANAVVSGMIEVSITSSDNSGFVNSIALVVDGTYRYLGGTSPIFTTWWDTRGLADGNHSFAVQVGDRAGYQYLSPAITVVVDNSLPTVTLDSPGAGPVGAAAALSASASHARGIQRVDFYRDGVRLIGTDTTAPYSAIWDTQTFSPGSHTITARAVSAMGTVATSVPVTFTTSDYTEPTVTLDAPLDAASVTGLVTLTATATDTPTPSVPQVQFYLDNTILLGTDTAAPYTFAWDATSVSAGSHVLTARAIDDVGNAALSTPAIVTVIPPDASPPVTIMDLTAW